MVIASADLLSMPLTHQQSLLEEMLMKMADEGAHLA